VFSKRSYFLQRTDICYKKKTTQVILSSFKTAGISADKRIKTKIALISVLFLELKTKGKMPN